MREKLVADDVLECVLGLGPNLFYNSPMEACVVICRMNKPKKRQNRVLFINAVNEVTRERAQSFLTDRHIERILNAYRSFDDEDGFAKVVERETILERKSNLSIPLYLAPRNGNSGNQEGEVVSLEQAIADWQESSQALHVSMTELFAMLENNREEVLPHE